LPPATLAVAFSADLLPLEYLSVLNDLWLWRTTVRSQKMCMSLARGKAYLDSRAPCLALRLAMAQEAQVTKYKYYGNTIGPPGHAVVTPGAQYPVSQGGA
jgi:hypothetical protein